MANKVDKNLSRKDYEKLGELLVSLGQLGITEGARKKIYRIAFFKGIITGLGGVIGATIVVALLLFLLSLFSEIPLIGDVFQSVESTIDNAKTAP